MCTTMLHVTDIGSLVAHYFTQLHTYAKKPAPCGTSDMNTWCHKCLRHKMTTVREQEKKDLGRGWHVRTMEAGRLAHLK